MPDPWGGLAERALDVAVGAIGAEGRLVGEEMAVYAPPVLVREFAFTSRTLF